MAKHTTDVTAFLDKCVPELRGERVHFTATSGEAEIHVCMSFAEARKMADQLSSLLDDAEMAEEASAEVFHLPRVAPPR